MANQLETLFSEIAGAIRQKNGETGTMKPVEFPAKIAAIEAGGGSGGGGSSGGTLDGIYLTLTETPGNGDSRFFLFRGNLYWLRVDSTNNVFRIYRHADGAFTEVASLASGGKFTNITFTTFVEYNGLLHFLGCTGSYSKAHVTWDGASTFTTWKDMPDYSEVSYNNNAVVIGGELYAVLGRTDLYKWDQTTDTWTKAATTQSTKLFLHEGNLYNYYFGNLYQWIDGVFTQIHSLDYSSDFPISQAEPLAVIGDWVYMFYNAGNRFYKYNVLTKELVTIGTTFGVLTNGRLCCVDGQMRYARNTTGYVTVHGIIG